MEFKFKGAELMWVGPRGDGMSDVEFELGVSWVAGGVERRADLMSSGESFLVIGYVVSEVAKLRP